MNNQEILTRAIGKAFENGWQWGKTVHVQEIAPLENRNGGPLVRYQDGNFRWNVVSLYWLILNHDFAKAFFGDKPHEYGHWEFQEGWDDDAFVKDGVIPTWQYHLQQMVIDPDPIAYLGRNI